MRLGCTSLLALSIGCGNVSSSNSTDALASTDTPLLDAMPICDPVGAFGPPMPVMGLEIAGLAEGVPRLSADELTLYFQGAFGSDPPHLYVTHRSALTA